MGITQERLVQELYDRRVLHNILGVEPQPLVIRDSDDEVDDERKKEPKSYLVESAWENGDGELQKIIYIPGVGGTPLTSEMDLESPYLDTLYSVMNISGNYTL
ncbi:hypothetical protein JR316_0009349 [Psilocybe cubensis]|uniref:Uncharacterized protein n=1 Tax=Psilocybe cubensis TaxID=181762 RepID=A0ACB8GU49_PSICU|nr:hypothetical protein JR316_0009349 [Psilocybe cubensis]KAH9478887.1 hypothetical protein JR316_0009349 [Psilocybe cubensis]